MEKKERERRMHGEKMWQSCVWAAMLTGRDYVCMCVCVYEYPWMCLSSVKYGLR